MSVLDLNSLQASPLADLHTIASELSIDGYRRLRRPELITAILERQGGGEGGPVALDVEADRLSARQTVSAAESETTSPAESETASGEGDDESEEERSGSRRRRGRRGRRGRAGAREDEPADDEASARRRSAEPVAAEPVAAEPVAAEPPDQDEASAAPEPRRRREPRRSPAAEREPRRSPAAEREPRRSPAAEREPEPADEDEPVTGVVELLANGSGFVRVDPPEASDDDVYISSAQVKRCELVSGDRIAGPKRAPRRSERFASLIRIETINGRAASELADSVRFDDLPSAFADQRLKIGSDDPTLKAIEWLTPFGLGSRVTIVGAPRSGKTEALRRLAESLAGRDELALTIILAGARPEEISEWNQGSVKPAAAVGLAASEDAYSAAIDPVIDQARRLAARGADAVVLIDTLAGAGAPTARRAMAAARNIVDGGSLTVIATADAPIGGETTVIALDVALTSLGRFPALDIIASGTLRPELLVGQAGAEAIARTRAEASDVVDDDE